MDVKLVAAVTGDLGAGTKTVTAFCQEHGISRQTFYKWRRRYQAGGLDGLENKSRAPHTHKRIGADIEDAIVRYRKDLLDRGLDAGPLSIASKLDDDPNIESTPAASTIWRTLVRRGFVTPEPKKRPRSSWRRFEFDRPNECWQIDATETHLADGTRAVIFNIIDDHSRVCVASRATPAQTSVAAWETFLAATQDWGVPAHVLSDNGVEFSGKIRGFEVVFETNLHNIGIKSLTSTPYHPQTCGKIERFQQTLKRWLAHHDPPETLDDLQDLIDAFVAYYNHERPHQGIGRERPIRRWRATPKAVPAKYPTNTPTRTRTCTVGADGTIQARPWRINIGRQYAGTSVTIITQANDCAIFDADTLIETRTINPNSRYQPRKR